MQCTNKLDLVLPWRDLLLPAEPIVSMSQVKIIPYKEKDEWNLVTKYNIGKKLNTKIYVDWFNDFHYHIPIDGV